MVFNITKILKKSVSQMVISFGVRGALIVCYSRKMISDIQFIKFSPENFQSNAEQVCNHISNYPMVPIKIVFDTDQQYFVTKNISKKMSKKDVKSHLAKKMDADIPYQGIKGYRKIDAIRDTTSVEYILMCLSLNQNVKTIISEILSLNNPIFGFYSYPMELYKINHARIEKETPKPKVKKVKKSKKKYDIFVDANDAQFTYDAGQKKDAQDSANKTWSVTLSLTETRGLRQVVMFGDSFVLTRTIEFLDDLYSFESAKEIKDSVDATLSYVEKISFLSREDIKLIVFGSAEFCNLVSNMDIGVANIQEDALQKLVPELKVSNLSSQYNYLSDIVIASSVYTKPFFEVHHNATKLHKLKYNINRFMKYGIFAAVFAICGSYFVFESGKLKLGKELQSKTTQYNRVINTYNQINDKFSIDDSRKIIQSAIFYEETPLSKKSYDVEGILARINNVASNFKGTYIKRFAIACSKNCATLNDIQIKVEFHVNLTLLEQESFRKMMRINFHDLTVVDSRSENSMTFSISKSS